MWYWYLITGLICLGIGLMFKREWFINMCLPKKEKSEPVCKCNVFRQIIILADIYRYTMVEIIVINPLKSNKYFVKIQKIWEDGSRSNLSSFNQVRLVIGANVQNLLENAKLAVSWEVSSQIIMTKELVESVEEYPITGVEDCDLGQFSLYEYQDKPYKINGSIYWYYTGIPSYCYHVNESGRLTLHLYENQDLINYLEVQLSGLMESVGDNLYVFPTMTSYEAYKTISDLVNNTLIKISFSRKLPKALEIAEVSK